MMHSPPAKPADAARPHTAAAEPALVLYGVARASAIQGDLPTGLDGAPIFSVPVPVPLPVPMQSAVPGQDAQLCALVSILPDSRLAPQPQVADLLAFQQIVAALHANCDVLPARFGCVGRAGELISPLQQRKNQYLAALSQLAGCVELALRISIPQLVPTEEPVSSASARPSGLSGTAYLRERQRVQALAQAEEARTQAIAMQIHAVFASLCRASQLRPAARHSPGGEKMPSAASHEVTLAMLVPREAVTELRQRFATYRQQTQHRVWLLGPWPPYSFCDGFQTSVSDENHHSRDDR